MALKKAITDVEIIQTPQLNESFIGENAKCIQ